MTRLKFKTPKNQRPSRMILVKPFLNSAWDASQPNVQSVALKLEAKS